MTFLDRHTLQHNISTHLKKRIKRNRQTDRCTDRESDRGRKWRFLWNMYLHGPCASASAFYIHRLSPWTRCSWSCHPCFCPQSRSYPRSHRRPTGDSGKDDILEAALCHQHHHQRQQDGPSPMASAPCQGGGSSQTWAHQLGCNLCNRGLLVKYFSIVQESMETKDLHRLCWRLWRHPWSEFPSPSLYFSPSSPELCLCPFICEICKMPNFELSDSAL